MLKFSSPIPLAIYLHSPWCVRKCPYCDFNSHETHGPIPERAYIDALLADLEQDLPRVWGRRIESVFIGGGTPSLLSAEALERLLSGLRARLPLRPDTEITLEANPGAVERGQLAEFREAGVNRLSIGVQSFNDEQLQQLGRIHHRRDAFATAEAAHTAGLDNFNLDLMFGLPGQTRLRSSRPICPITSSRLSRTPPFTGRRPPCPMTKRWIGFSSRRWLSWRGMVTPATKCRLTPATTGGADIIATTGSLATIWGLALALTAN